MTREREQDDLEQDILLQIENSTFLKKIPPFKSRLGSKKDHSRPSTVSSASFN